MGVQLNPLARKLSIMMKSVAVVALCFFAAVAAEADADADADAYYAHYGYGHHLGHHFGHGLAYGHGYGHGYYGHPYAYGHYYGKRSAEDKVAHVHELQHLLGLHIDVEGLLELRHIRN